MNKALEKKGTCTSFNKRNARREFDSAHASRDRSNTVAAPQHPTEQIATPKQAQKRAPKQAQMKAPRLRRATRRASRRAPGPKPPATNPRRSATRVARLEEEKCQASPEVRRGETEEEYQASAKARRGEDPGSRAKEKKHWDWAKGKPLSLDGLTKSLKQKKYRGREW